MKIPMTSDPVIPLQERRRYPRAQLSMLVQFRAESYEEFFREYATNVSLGGMFIRTDTPREKGESLYFQFTVRGTEVIEGYGRVVHVNPIDGSLPAGMGIEFIGLDEESREMIDEIVQLRMAKAQSTVSFQPEELQETKKES